MKFFLNGWERRWLLVLPSARGNRAVARLMRYLKYSRCDGGWDRMEFEMLEEEREQRKIEMAALKQREMDAVGECPTQ